MQREKWGSTALCQPQYLKKNQFIDAVDYSQAALHHQKPIWELNHGLHRLHLWKLRHFYFKMRHCAFNGTYKSYGECERSKKYRKVSFVAIIMHRWLISRYFHAFSLSICDVVWILSFSHFGYLRLHEYVQILGFFDVACCLGRLMSYY